MSPTTKLTPRHRREMILAVLSGESQASVARRYGVDRAHVLRLVRDAREADHEARIAEAEAEAAFWRRVKERA